MAASGCPHIAKHLGDVSTTGDTDFIQKYKTVVSWNVRYAQSVRNPAKRRKVFAPMCGVCDLALSRPFACLHCDFAGCWLEGHALGHLRDAGHNFCADTKTGSIFCAQCQDFIYHPKVDEIYLAAVVMTEEQQTKFQVSKKLREPYQIWVPEAKDILALKNSVPIPCQARRGLLNLGQTCFLNVVLQSFAHNPLLRNYFLSDKHNSKQCKTETCTCCEMDKLFTEIYSEDPNPYGPITFLATTWRASAELSGYAQQDAHEFFISALNQIHSTSRGSTEVSCNCIIHSTFAGQLQSDVKCERCGNITNTIDPMLDISLELKGKGGEVAPGDTLAACLRRFTQFEKLGPKEYTCSKCAKISHEASKRLSIRTLPPVLSFQFKRFEHKTNDKSSARKIDAQVRFPASINMAPYTTLVIKDMEGANANDARYTCPAPEVMYEYDLFAVINHEGQIDTGHYTNYACFQDEWYKFDDDKVTPSTLGACLASAAYMCFYVKRHLDYKPNIKPSYVQAHEAEAVREKELEREREAARIKDVEDALLATV
ncbi:uncharacterized protein LACBIDRAFT_305245 [Laccaria bicolor S238N-H82]|uniref:Ubiquitin carboxyl-terminal hydrolase n=1 Tax=Laccaria bicolor (strain S238N-H82 / ATCC MYA-4686) TaxID=486041 RepID=B0CTS3_LACBS|nr:uncharacterized protein LACBIDRAFT_305245 [Laccaria bicolor S238N-H82]EDR13968.1 predicted protein [Laccaria bicolor S238N-H82]|eukprot:XP_001874527.1 predicted protein [Laccaria bicolor S238N-H82]